MLRWEKKGELQGMCTECEECHWLHFSKGRAEAHVLRDVRQYSGGSKMLVFWPNEWPLCGQHQILIQNQNPLRQSPLRNIPDPLRHIVSVQSNAKHLCGFQSNLIRFLISEAKPIFQTEGQIPTKQQKQKLKKGEKKGPGYSGNRQPPLCQGEWATYQSSRGPRQHALQPERKFLKEIVSFHAGGQLR